MVSDETKCDIIERIYEIEYESGVNKFKPGGRVAAIGKFVVEQRTDERDACIVYIENMFPKSELRDMVVAAIQAGWHLR